MSFLYEHDILSKIVTAAFEKEAQQAQLADTNQLAKKLVAHLAGELSGVSSDKPTGAGLKLENLQNLGKLLQFLDENQIKFNGERVVYNQSELQNLAEDVRDKLSPVSINVSRDALTRQWNQADFYTNLNALTGYVAHLQQKSNEEKNPVLQVMVGKLIDQVNQVKPDSGLVRKPKSTPGKPNELPDETVIDGFGAKVFDIKNPSADRGNLALTAKDLKTKESLNAWLQQNPEAQVAMYDDKNQRTLHRYTDPSIDLNKAWANIVNTIFARAQRLAQLAKSPDETKKFGYYVKKLGELGATSVSTTPTATTEQQSVQNKDEKATQPGANSAVSAQLAQSLNHALSALPLSIREVNLDDIQSFFRLVEPVFTGDRASRLQAYIADAETKMSALKRMMQYNDAIYPLGIAPKQFASRLKQPTTSYLAALDRLTEIVDLTRQVMAELYSAYGRQLSAINPNEVAVLLGQIGRNRTDNSIYSRNIEDLNELKAGVNQVARVV
jgi:hypothetical protein